ncbi:hypothetical protein C1646_772174 [Rhizophagus diaphanus]|nr:hypothetical protein C1646_772174 [Rhizophagus diaphanus] [Rhizophagus sp. MUCL 43196]
MAARNNLGGIYSKQEKFDNEKTFKELVELIIQIKKFEKHGKIYENIVRFARAIDTLKWNSPIVAMTDCTKVHAKLTYFQELGCIVGSIITFENICITIYDDIHQIINNIREKMLLYHKYDVFY